MAWLRARLADIRDLPKIRWDQEKVLLQFFSKDKNPQAADVNIIAAEVTLRPHHVRVSLPVVLLSTDD